MESQAGTPETSDEASYHSLARSAFGRCFRKAASTSPSPRRIGVWHESWQDTRCEPTANGTSQSAEIELAMTMEGAFPAGNFSAAPGEMAACVEQEGEYLGFEAILQATDLPFPSCEELEKTRTTTSDAIPATNSQTRSADTNLALPYEFEISHICTPVPFLMNGKELSVYKDLSEGLGIIDGSTEESNQDSQMLADLLLKGIERKDGKVHSTSQLPVRKVKACDVPQQEQNRITGSQSIGEYSASTDEPLSGDYTSSLRRTRGFDKLNCLPQDVVGEAKDGVNENSQFDKGGGNEEEMKRVRRVKNRASVEKCRLKQRLRMEALQSEMTTLQAENKTLRDLTVWMDTSARSSQVSKATPSFDPNSRQQPSTSATNQ